MTNTISTSYSHWGLIADAELTAHLSAELETPEAKPDLPAEVHNTTPIDPEACIRAVRVLCGGGAR
jgi:hypothetical protein